CAIWFEFGFLFPVSIIHVPCKPWMCYLIFYSCSCG
ncbi:Os08g0334701, partial [Oryza sativa Japonica Group]